MIVQSTIEEVLDDLVSISRDAETAFAVCAHATRNTALSATLATHALVCGGAAHSLSMVGSPRRDDQRIRKLAGNPDWLALHDAMRRRDDVSVRDECIRTEDETLVHFRDALEQELPAGVERIVHRYFAALLEQHGSLQAVPVQREQRDPFSCYLLHHGPVDRGLVRDGPPRRGTPPEATPSA